MWQRKKRYGRQERAQCCFERSWYWFSWELSPLTRLLSDRVQNERAVYNSHMGGAQEWLIRTVRVVLSSLLQDQAQELDDETLQTLFTEAENVVNSRPLMIGNYQIQMRINQSLRTTSLHLKPGLYYHLLETSRVQICTQEIKAVAQNTLPVRSVLASMVKRVLHAATKTSEMERNQS